MAVTTDEFDIDGATVSSSASTLIDHSPTGPNALAVNRSTSVGDANYTILPTDVTVILTAAPTTLRSWLLPSAAAVSAGYEITVIDASGAIVFPTSTIVVGPSGSDTLLPGTVSLQKSYMSASFRSNGVDKWQALGPGANTGFDNAAIEDLDVLTTLLIEPPAASLADDAHTAYTTLDTGWTPTADATNWTYVSATSFTINGESQAASYPKGTKLWITQAATDKYFVVVSAVAGSGKTTFTVTGGTDYTVTNNAPTLMCYSYAVTPRGWPGWFNTTPTYTGFSANPTTPVYQFRVDGTMCTYVIRDNANGTSNATSLTVTVPITAVTLTNGVWTAAARVLDNGTTLTTPGMVQVSSAGTTVSCFKDWNSATTWTAAAGKRVIAATLVYPI